MSRKRTIQSSEINVVPYIDVMLVLLIIFMITAPLLEQGVEVDLPKTEFNKNVEMPDANSVFLVSINEKGIIHASYDGETKVINEKELKELSLDFHKNNNNAKAYLKADKSIIYDKVITTMDILKGSGFDKVGLISKNN